jgi:hypothetical protein
MAPTDEDLHSLARDGVSTDTDGGSDWENTSGADADGKTPGAANIGGARAMSFAEETHIDIDRTPEFEPVVAPQLPPGVSILDGVLIESEGEDEVSQPAPAVLSPLSPPVGAALIDFDDVTAPPLFSDTVRLTDRYAALGVIFEGPRGNDGGAILNEAGGFGISGHSSPNFLAFNSTATLDDGGTAKGPETLRFDPSVRSVNIIAARGHSAGGEMILEAFDASNMLVDSAAITLSNVMSPIRVSGSRIARVVISSTAESFVLDDLTFSRNGEYPTTWDAYLGTDPSATELIFEDLTETSCDPGGLNYGTTYYWRVIAKNQFGQSTGPNEGSWSFTTESRDGPLTIGLDAVHATGEMWVNSLGESPDFEKMRDELRAADFTLEILYDFTPASLGACDAIFIRQAAFTSNVFTAVEIANIHNYVASGGGLLAIAEGGFSTSRTVDNFNTLLRPYGIRVHTDPSQGNGRRVTGFIPHQVTDGITAVELNYHRRLASIAAPAIDLTLGSDEDDILAAVDGGRSGNTVIMSDSSTFGYPGDDTNLYRVDNLKLLMNVASYLTVNP